MAIKPRETRDTYRSNVKSRPLKQNGLEAQYQGLDISEVNIDHAGLAIIGRGGHQTRRDIRKVRKQYIVDVPQEEHRPTAELTFAQGLVNDTPLSPFFIGPEDDSSNVTQGWGYNNHSLQLLDTVTFDLTGSDGTEHRFRFTSDSTHVNGQVIPSSTDIAVNIFENQYSKRELMFAITGSIEAVFPEDTFSFQLYASGSQEYLPGSDEPITVIEDKIKLILSSSVVGSAALVSNTSFLSVDNIFDDQRESFEWRLNGLVKDESLPTIFYEDLRIDTIRSADIHSLRHGSFLPRSEQFDPSVVSENYKNFYDKNIDSIAGDPTDSSTGLNRFDTHTSEEIIIRQYPRRETIFDTYRSNHQWREDIHYLSADQQVWSRMEEMALTYHSSLESHISSMIDSNFADEQYIDPNPLSGRVDVFGRLSRVFDTHIQSLIFDRHPMSVFDQYLDPIDDFINLHENRYPVADQRSGDAPFEDVKGKRSQFDPMNLPSKVEMEHNNSMMFIDYFDQEPLENHDYIENKGWTRIDDEMLVYLTSTDWDHDDDSSTSNVATGRSFSIDRREWEESNYIYTATGFVSSQTSGQDGIIYREMKR